MLIMCMNVKNTNSYIENISINTLHQLHDIAMILRSSMTITKRGGFIVFFKR